MELKGGVIIIGSLIWEDHLNHEKQDNIRLNWRNQNLINTPILTSVPIRYARRSQTRKNTYTMIFSKSCENQLGQGLIFGFNDVISGFENIERQAIALAIAEGIYKEDNKRLTSNWGSVGLLINPRLQEKDRATYELIKEKWSQLYAKYADTFVSSRYSIDGETESPITQNGLLNINWQENMNDFDVLLATPVTPNPSNRYPTVKEIADKITETGYNKYLNENIRNNIKTFQDDGILNILKNHLH